MNEVNRKFITIKRGNVNLAGILEKPELKSNETCPIVIFMHARLMDSNEMVFQAIAKGLLENKIATLRFDFNGHGRSSGNFADMTVVNEIEDAEAVLRYANEQPFVSGISLIGHSQGGIVAGMLAGYHVDDIASLVLMAPAGNLKDIARMGFLGTEFQLKHSEYVTIFGMKVRKEYVETVKTLPIYEVSEKYHGPVCLVHGTRDGMVPYRVSEKYHKLYKNSEIHPVHGGDHMFSNVIDIAAKTVVEFIVKVFDKKY